MAHMPQNPMQWHYDIAEMRADAVVHVAGLIAAVVAAGFLVWALIPASPGEFVGVAVYIASFISAFGASAAYNMWPVSPTKWILRRLDHSMIYVFIAGTYTPFIVKAGGVGWALLAVVWGVAAVGVVVKMMFPGRYDRLSVIAYIALGWSGIALYGPLSSALSPGVLVMIAVGGVVYTTGVIFHLWRSLRFQNAIWHAFVLAGAVCHYDAVLQATTLIHGV